MVAMWKGNDFGLTLLGPVNEALRLGHSHETTSSGNLRVQLPDAEEHEEVRELQRAASGSRIARHEKMSTRGAFFLVMYCWVFAVTGMNLIASLYRDEGMGGHINDVLNAMLWIAVVMVVLLIHSAVTHVPCEQPYRLAYATSRLVLFFVAVYQTHFFLQWLPNVEHPNGHAPTGHAMG